MHRNVGDMATFGKNSIEVAVMAQNLVKSVVKLLFPFECSILTNICCACTMHLKRAVDSQACPSEMTHVRLRRHRWNVDPIIKNTFNDIVKGSQSFNVAETQGAIKHFNNLTTKTKLPDYMAVKMASIAVTHLGWEEGKKILEKHYMAQSAELRFAGEASVMDEQVKGAICRIFDNMDGDAYKIARQFYCRLIDLKFCKVKDSVLKIFIQDLLKKNQIKQAVEEFDYFSNYGKHGSLSGTAFFVLRAAFKKNDEFFQKAVEIINRSTESRLQQICILGCVFLIEEFHIQFVDFLRKQNYSISTEDVEFICNLACKCKEPVVLESLVNTYELFKLTDKSRARIYGSLIEIHGKANNLIGLLKIWERIITEKNLNNFRVVILKLGHFYKCNNFSIPTDMQYYLRQYRE
ncbi:Deuterosome assembly protein [Dirofilaria immitis]